MGIEPKPSSKCGLDIHGQIFIFQSVILDRRMTYFNSKLFVDNQSYKTFESSPFKATLIIKLSYVFFGSSSFTT